MLHNPELRLKSRSGQDRGDTLARTTDKGFPQGRIYSLVLRNNLNETQVETKAPHILTYGLEGLEGLRVGNSDALTKLGHLKSSLIDLEARQGDRAQAYQYAA